MKIFSWNVNGIRAVFRNGFRNWLKKTDPDIVCLQEIKADSSELSEEYKEIDGYWVYFNSAEKKGYSGTAVYTKFKPQSVEMEIDMKQFDKEGRCLKLNFKDFTLFNFYIPHSGRAKENLDYKLSVYKKLLGILEPFAKKQTLLAGDFNIAHTEQDLYFPKQNTNNVMFTPEERRQIESLINLGYTDTFRHKYPDKKSYTWWPYRNNLRERDIGWRIDYIFVSKPLLPSVKDAFTRKEIRGSDHCPYGISLNKKLTGEKGSVYKKRLAQALF